MMFESTDLTLMVLFTSLLQTQTQKLRDLKAQVGKLEMDNRMQSGVL